ncbi:radical SAM protein [Magnetospirillum sp. SS-4]|uniref:radical SAM protein n=1 Tax=Magnetospirillum sp. SS-4 TaxID=2681465 RepID=UPI0013812645|nr:radical SAM protein [Magnetospirillum sp. SS-4]CAA7619608.1 putative Radical SAM additional 4Fe4S-binding domain-containing protein [Magnetospirillum sp. SS-4]
MSITIPLSKDWFRPEIGHCWTISNALTGLDAMIRDGLTPRITVTENGIPLGPSNAIHEEIRYTGYGRYALAGNLLYLSASDSSDPTTNDREYAVIVEEYVGGTPLPPPRIMHVGITGSCNMTCRICRPEDGAHGNTIKDPCIDKLILDAIPTLQELRLDSAGEPTLHKPKFRRLVSEASRHGVPVFMCTNAVLIDEEMADFICAGTSVKRIQISIDSPEKETLEWVRRGANFEALLAGARNLVAARKRHNRPDILLNFHAALLKQNIAQLPDLIRLAHEIGVDQVSCMFGAVHAYMDMEWSVFWCQEEHNRAIEEAEVLAKELDVCFRPWGKFDIGADPTEKTPTDPASNLCYYLSHWTYVDPNGIIRPCCISSNHFLGDLNTEGFLDIWRGEKYEELRRSYNTDNPSNPTCAKCYIRTGWNRHSYKSYFGSPLWPAVRKKLELPEDE